MDHARRRAMLLAAALVATLTADALAQATMAIRPGQRVRVRSTVAHAPELVGVLEAARSDSIVIRGDAGGMATAVPRASVTHLDVSRGRRSKWLPGMLIGAAAGAAAGAALGAAAHDETDPLFDSGDDAVLGAIVGAPAGALAGALIGLMIRTERWESVPLDRLSLRVTPGSPGRVRVGLTLGL